MEGTASREGAEVIKVAAAAGVVSGPAVAATGEATGGHIPRTNVTSVETADISPGTALVGGRAPPLGTMGPLRPGGGRGEATITRV